MELITEMEESPRIFSLQEQMEDKFRALIQSATEKLSGVPVDSKEFPEICEEILSNSEFFPREDDLSSSYLWNSDYQHYKKNEFSHFPLTLHSWRDFHLDLYLWEKGRTSLHDHHFQGAFKVIKGKYLQTIFDFTPGLEIFTGVNNGKISQKLTEYVPVSGTRQIISDTFLHSVHHEEKVNITLCLRSKDLKPNLHNFYFPGLRVAYRSIQDRNRQYLDHLWSCAIELKQSVKIDAEIPMVDVINFSESRVRTDKQFNQWWDLVQLNFDGSKIVEIRNALFKTHLF